MSLPAKLCLGVALLMLPSGTAVASVPPRVRPQSKAWGGGSADSPTHNRPMQEQPGSERVDELVEVPSWEVFHRKYVRRNRPVVFRGIASSHRAFNLWGDDTYLVKNWGSKSINVELEKTEERGGSSLQMSVKQFLSEMSLESRKTQLYALMEFDDDQTAKADFEFLQPISCKEIKPQSLTLWMSSGGTTSVLHQDDAENFLIQLSGNKSFMLVHQDQAQNLYAPIAAAHGTSPVHQEHVDLVNFPKFAGVHWLHGELKSGDVLYIPHTYWHQVNSYGRNLAANLWWGHTHDWQWWDPHNPDEYDATRFGSKGFPKFDWLKSRGPDNYPCTSLPQGTSLQNVKFVDETKFKRVMSKRHKHRKSGSNEL